MRRVVCCNLICIGIPIGIFLITGLVMLVCGLTFNNRLIFPGATFIAVSICVTLLFTLYVLCMAPEVSLPCLEIPEEGRS